MKVKVIKSFIDKETKKSREVGEVFDCSEARYEQIETVGHFVEQVEKKKESEAKPSEK